MGKGDRKSKKGKLWRGSYGNRRPRPAKSLVVSKSAKSKKAKSKTS
ncbi:30S ribosomal protein THX [Hyphobacterium sp. CCMP332]|nr:30S ribosomal protein THX [Hyphobacterium sp. CCMP332]